VARCSISSEFRWVLGDGDDTMRIRRMRWPRLLVWNPRLLPGLVQRGGWSENGAGVLRVSDDGVDLRRIGPSQLVRETCQGEEKILEVREEADADQRWRIRPEKLADTVESGEGFRRLEWVFA
jgi:hypothetical protein